jgi:hypothetical protein
MAVHYAPGYDGLIIEPDFATFTEVFMSVWRDQIPGEDRLWKLTRKTHEGLCLEIYASKSKTTRVFIRSGMNLQTVKRIDGLTTIAWAGIDEPARMITGEVAFQKALGRLRVPLPGYKYNPLLIVGSPLGLNHWTAGAFGCQQDHPAEGYVDGYFPDPVEKPGYYIRACRTRDNATHLQDNYEHNCRVAFGEALAEQEFNASLMSTRGMVLPEWSAPKNVLIHGLVKDLWERRVRTSPGGADWGTTRPAAAVVTGWTGDRELVVPALWYEAGRHIIQQGVAMHALQEEWAKTRGKTRNFIQWYGDPYRPGNIKLLQQGFDYDGKHYPGLSIKGAKTGRDVGTKTGAWQAGIDLLRNMMSLRRGVDHPAWPVGNQLGAPRFYVSDRCKPLLDEIPKYRYPEIIPGKPIPGDADPLCDDHAIDCVRYAAYSTATRGVVRSYSRAA